MIRSPFFYVGDKYKLMPQISCLFPKEIATYVEPFLGGGSSFLYTTAKEYKLNDINGNMIELHNWFISNSKQSQKFYQELVNLSRSYNLSVSVEGDVINEFLKKQYKKTYYAHRNKASYLNLRNDYNQEKRIDQLYLLLIYGFNHMIRFNKKGEFNLPVGNVDFNKNVKSALFGYMNTVKNRKISLYSLDYTIFLKELELTKEDFVYFDPPYLITNSEYNRFWGEEKERELYKLIDDLNAEGIKFGLSNSLVHKGKKNEILDKWKEKYKVYEIKSNYISYHDNTNKLSGEIYVTNV